MSKTLSISRIRKKEIYSLIGNSLHYLKQYEKALNYYQKCVDLGVECDLLDLIYLADCQNKLNLAIKIPDLNKEAYFQQPRYLKAIYSYFLNVEIPAFAKENYIIKEIVPSLRDEGLINVFRYEIDKIVEETGHYKLLYIFEKMIEENLML